MVAPVGLAICKKLKMNPVGMILSIAVSSNLHGAATLVGDTTLGIEPHLLYSVGLLRKEGYQVSFGEFMRIGIPYTFAAVLTGYLYFWFIWA